MAIPIDTKLYNRVFKKADIVFEKPSAYKSMWIQREYKKQGGTYQDDGQERKLERWKNEEWKDVGKKDYPVFRPTKKITKDTPLTVAEIDPSNLKKQIALKQKIKGNKNLPPFLKGGKLEDDLLKWSNPVEVKMNANKYLGKDVPLYYSTRSSKKYMVITPDNKLVHFGQQGYEDYTKHKDEKRRSNYLARSSKIKGDWANNKYSPNNLSIHLLWNG
jgi:hypothetical protein